MLFQPENAAVVKTDSLENSVAVKQTVVENGNLRFSLGIKFSVDVDLRVLRPCSCRSRFIHRWFYCFTRFWFIQHRPTDIRSFHKRWKNLVVSTRNSSGKMES